MRTLQSSIILAKCQPRLLGHEKQRECVVCPNMAQFQHDLQLQQVQQWAEHGCCFHHGAPNYVEHSSLPFNASPTSIASHTTRWIRCPSASFAHSYFMRIRVSHLQYHSITTYCSNISSYQVNPTHESKPRARNHVPSKNHEHVLASLVLRYYGIRICLF